MTQARNIVRPNFIPPMPWVTPWVAGRFYDCSVMIPTLSTSVHNTQTWCEPFFIPQAITLSSVGIEVTVGATAGGLFRFAVYNSRYETWMPWQRLADLGTTASDTTGFLFVSATSVYIAQPGCYWFCSACSGATTATVRTLGNTLLAAAFFSRLAFSTLTGPAGSWAMRFPIDGATVVSTGFPSLAPVSGIDTNATDAMTFTRNEQQPRIMVGV